MHEAQRAHASLLQYRTRAPKGIFIYRNHEEMEADRDGHGEVEPGVVPGHVTIRDDLQGAGA